MCELFAEVFGNLGEEHTKNLENMGMYNFLKATGLLVITLECGEILPVVPHKAVAEVSRIGNL